MIASMKKARLVVLKEDLDKVLVEIQRADCFMIRKQTESANFNPSNDGTIARTDQDLKILSKYQAKSGLFGDYYESNFDSLNNIDDSSIEVLNKVEELFNKRQKLEAEVSASKEEIASLAPWTMLSIKLNELKGTKHTSVHVGFVELKQLDAFVAELDAHNVIYELLEQVKMQKAICFITYCDDDEAIMESAKSCGFADYSLPVFDGTVTDYIDSLEEKINGLNGEISSIDDSLHQICESIPKLKLYVDQLLTKKARLETDFAATVSVYYLDGFIPNDKIDVLTAAVEKVTSFYDLEITEPEEDEDVPTCLVNKKVVAPFESITNSFSVPSWKELDPNPVMAVWYWFLFGMMVGDVGYGIVLFIGSFIFLKFLHPKKGTADLAKIFMYSSITTVFWGIIFNSYFGASLPFYKAVVSPMTQPMEMLILSVAVGVLHIVTGLVMKAVKDIRAKDVFEMLAKDLSWILIILGLSVYCVTIKFPIDVLKYVGIGMIGLGVVFILLFSGHKKKNIFAKGAFGLLGLYDVTSYLGDLLSYTRIMALVMSSAAVASVMNTLAGMVQGNIIGWVFSILIYVIGHVFNLVLALLSAYVHDCRLQYIEFYGKFYDGGGYEFTPLSAQTKYTNEVKE